jgi:hypothetical protein
MIVEQQGRCTIYDHHLYIDRVSSQDVRIQKEDKFVASLNSTRGHLLPGCP